MSDAATWGVLVHAPKDIIEPLLRELGQLRYRTNGSWTAVFKMEPGDTSDNEAADILARHEFDPLYKFDFNKYEYLTYRRVGDRWERDRDPAYVLGDLGFDLPGWEQPTPKGTPTLVREASIIEGTSLQQGTKIVREALGPGDAEPRIEDGPRGTIVYDPHVNLRIRLWTMSPGRVYDIEFYPVSGDFYVQIMRGEQCEGTFRPGATRTWDGTPFLPSIEQETDPARIIEKLGIEHSFLDPSGS